MPLQSLFRSVVLSLILSLCVAVPALADDPAQHKPAAEAGDDPSKVIATVLGKEITAKDQNAVNGLIVSALMHQFAADRKLAPTEAEIDTFVERTEVLERQQIEQLEKKRDQLKAELKDSALPETQRKEKEQYLGTIDQVLSTLHAARQKSEDQQEALRQMKRRMAGEFIRHWKVNKALYEQYGGRVIFQQAGPEPLDAYRKFLEEREKAGAFKILEPSLSEPFWRYFRDDKMHNFYPEAEGKKFMTTPWWMMDIPPMQ